MTHNEANVALIIFFYPNLGQNTLNLDPAKHCGNKPILIKREHKHFQFNNIFGDEKCFIL